MISFTILGEPASKSNSRRLVTIRGRPAIIKSKKANDYTDSAILQIPSLARQGIDVPVRVAIEIYYASRRPDLDASVIFDVLQKAGVIKNDRLIHEQHLRWNLDRLSPRGEVEVEIL